MRASTCNEALLCALRPAAEIVPMLRDATRPAGNAAAMQSVVALASPCFRLAPSDGHGGAGEGAASAAGDVHCVVPHERMGPDES